MNRGAAKHGKQDNATHTTSRQVPRGEMRWTLIREGRNRCTVIGGKRERERRRSMRRRMRDFQISQAGLYKKVIGTQLRWHPHKGGGVRRGR